MWYYPPGQGLGRNTTCVFPQVELLLQMSQPVFFSDVESSQVVLTQLVNCIQLQFLFGILKWLFEFKDSCSFTGWYHSLHSHTPFQRSKDQSCYILIVSAIFHPLPQFQKTSCHLTMVSYLFYSTKQQTWGGGGMSRHTSPKTKLNQHLLR